MSPRTRYAALVSLACALFLWTIVAAIAAGGAAFGTAIFLGSAVRRSKFGMVSGGLIAAAGAVVALGSLLFIGGWLLWGMWPHESTSRAAFEDAFGIPAGAEVTGIRSRTTSSTDSHEQFLRFHAPPATVAAITRTRFRRATADECRQEWRQWNGDAPEWWKPSMTPRADCYIAEPYDKRLAFNAAWLLYDSVTGEAHFHYAGVE